MNAYSSCDIHHSLVALQGKAKLFINLVRFLWSTLRCTTAFIYLFIVLSIRSSPSNSSSAVAYDCADILNATTSPSSTEQEEEQDSVSDDAYENAKLNCMLKAITSR